ncbi:MAG: hypothetical protein J5509_02015, partial [Lachnospiraceae bacterium]|nr:hypothetical protein [Lachnospiraceae bacterium]
MKPQTTGKKHSARLQAISVVYASVCAVFMLLGSMIGRNGAIEFSDPVPWIAMVLSFILTGASLYFFLRYTSQSELPSGDDDVKKGKLSASLIRNALIIFACWIPVFLAEFPGFFVYDAVDEYTAVATRTFTTHHPLLHTLFLGGSVRAGEAFAGSANAGIAFYILVQMAVLSLVFSWVISTMKRFRIFGLIWYALFPTVVMFALCSVKDTVFAAAVLVSVVLTVKVLKREAGRADQICLLAALLIMMLNRHNGVYAFIIYACVMGGYLAATIKGTMIKRIAPALALAGVLFVYQLISMGLVAVLHADDSEHQEMLTVPIQQLARTWSVYGDEFSEEELETLYEILPEDTLKHYTPELSDPVKIGFDNAAYEADPGRYRNLWLSLFKKHPLSYVNAWLNTCYGYFYPFTVVNVYEGHQVYTFTYTESSYFGYEVEYPGERHSFIAPIDRLYRWLSLDDDIQR